MSLHYYISWLVLHPARGYYMERVSSRYIVSCLYRSGYDSDFDKIGWSCQSACILYNDRFENENVDVRAIKHKDTLTGLGTVSNAAESHSTSNRSYFAGINADFFRVLCRVESP